MLALATLLLATEGALPGPRLGPLRVEHAPTVDGRLDEAEWNKAPASSAFTQKFPAESAPPTEATAVRVLYDDRDLYIGVTCEQRAAPVVGRLARRDRAVESDRVEIDLDSRHDRVSAFHFEVNAAGVLVDGVRYDDTELSLEWDENWTARTARSGTGWSAEIRIPLRVLRFDPAGQDWGLQVRRYVSLRREIDEWAFIPRSEAGEVSRYGTVGPFARLPTGGGLELRPFAVISGSRHGEDGGSLDATGSVGLDAKWHITQDLTLDAAVLPDFGQVEADQVVLNLESYELFLPEKRPFFLEGVGPFSTPVTVLYTRRIGAAPDEPALPDGESALGAPTPAPIYGAAKLVGRLGQRTTVGALSAVVGETRVDTETATGAAAERTASPLTTFHVARVQQAMGANADVGLIGAATLRSESAADYPMLGEGILCPGGAVVAAGDRCTHDAAVAGADGRWRSASGAYLVQGQVLASAIRGGPPRQLPDGTTLCDGDVSPGASLLLAKQAGTIRGELEYEGYGRRVDLDDLGYLQRQNLHSFWSVAELYAAEPTSWAHDGRARLEVYRRENLDGLHLASGYQINSSATFRNFWGSFVELHLRPAHYDDREVGDGTALERAGLIGLELEVESDPRRIGTGAAALTLQKLANGDRVEGATSFAVHPTPQLDLEISPEVGFTRGEPRFVGPADDGSPTFGEQQALSLGAILRAAFAFTPELTLQAYGQLFTARVSYDRFYQAAIGDRVVDLDDLAPTTAPAEDPGFRAAAFNASGVLRWEYRLGSTLFLVYSRAQAADRAGGGALDTASALRAPATDVILLKLSYWWGL